MKEILCASWVNDSACELKGNKNIEDSYEIAGIILGRKFQKGLTGRKFKCKLGCAK